MFNMEKVKIAKGKLIFWTAKWINKRKREKQDLGLLLDAFEHVKEPTHH